MIVPVPPSPPQLLQREASPADATLDFAELLAQGGGPLALADALSSADGGAAPAGAPVPADCTTQRPIVAERFNEHGFFQPFEPGAGSPGVGEPHPADDGAPVAATRAELWRRAPLDPLAPRSTEPAGGQPIQGLSRGLTASGPIASASVAAPGAPRGGDAAARSAGVPGAPAGAAPPRLLSTGFESASESAPPAARLFAQRLLARLAATAGAQSPVQVALREIEQGLHVAVKAGALSAEERARLRDEIAALLGRHGLSARAIHIVGKRAPAREVTA